VRDVASAAVGAERAREPRRRRREPMRPAVIAFALLALAACGRPKPEASAPPGRPPASSPQPSSPSAAPAPVEDPAPDEAVDPAAPVDTVTIKLIVDQRRQAHVWWGRKDFGVAPVEIKRPRSSGPLDLVIVAPGYLP